MQKKINLYMVCQNKKSTWMTLLFFLAIVPHLIAQREAMSKDTICLAWSYTEHVVPEYFKPGYQTTIFGDNVNMRDAPALTSAVLAVLPIGQQVQVVAFDTTRLTINGRTACWHLVGWSDAKEEQKQGWVWGGYLSLAGGGCESQPLFLLGCTEVKTIIDNRVTAYVHEIKAVKDFRLIDKIQLPEVTVHEAQIFYLGIQSSRGLPDVQHVVNFQWASATCGGIQENFYLLWTENDQFQLLPPIKSMGESGFYTQLEKYIFPDEIEEIKYTYPLMYLYEKPENRTAILYYKEDSGGDEDGAGISISISKLKFVNGIWIK